MSEFIIPRIPLDAEGLCAHATIESANIAFGLPKITQDLLSRFVTDSNWGTEPTELINMARSILPVDHIIFGKNFSLQKLQNIFEKYRAVIILDITDKLNRISKKTGKCVNDVDGHYVIFAGIVDEMAIIIDPSADEIATDQGIYSKKLGLVLTDCENIYKLPISSLESIWNDTKKDGSINNKWALIMIHPDDDPITKKR